MDYWKRISYYLKRLSQLGERGLRSASQTIAERKDLLKKAPGFRQIGRLASSYKLAFAIGGAIVGCLLLTYFSVLLYSITGTGRLDLSRPGYEGVRQRVDRTPPSTVGFNATGALNAKVIENYLIQYNKQSQTLSHYDAFDPKLLDDAQLNLSDAATSPPDSASP